MAIIIADAGTPAAKAAFIKLGCAVSLCMGRNYQMQGVGVKQ